MTETTTLTGHTATVERSCADQVTESRPERTEPIQQAPEALSAVAVEETRTTKETETAKTVQWFETEPPREVEEKVETKTTVKQETKQVRWYEGYRPGYFC